MNSFHLFKQRMANEWKFQYGVIKAIADWTIQLYLIIPSMIIGSVIYRSWWIEPPVWNADIPGFFYFAAGILIAGLGRYRTFAEYGDKVFLVKRKPLFFGLKKWSYLYSLFIKAILIALLIVVLLPLMRQNFEVNLMNMAALFFYFYSLSLFLSSIKIYLHSRLYPWLKGLYKIVAFIFTFLFTAGIYRLWMYSPLLVVIPAIILFSISVYLYGPRLGRISDIDEELAVERRERIKYINLIFTLSKEVPKPKIITSKKPLFFRNSRKIFKKRTPVNGFLELFVKVFFRDSSFLSGYYQMLSVTVAAMFLLPPFWLKIPVFIAFIIMLYIWLSDLYDKVLLTNPLTKKYEYQDAFLQAKKRAVIVFLIPAVLIVGAALSVVILL